MNDTNEIRSILVESTTRLFTDHIDHKLPQKASEQGYAPELWRIVEDAQLQLISVPENAGGAGGSMADLGAVLRVAGRFSAPLPIAETAIAAWVLARCGLPIPQGPLAFGPVHGEEIVAHEHGAQWILSGSMKRVPWLRTARHLVLLASSDKGTVVACIDPGHCHITPGRNLASEPRDDAVLDAVRISGTQVATAPVGIDATSLHLRCTVARALLTAGALERALELSVRYATERVQFGREIGQFQAIQQELARLAGEVAAAIAAAMSAAGTFEQDNDPTLVVASAKIRTAQSAHEAALIAHQVHGAIGVTDEHALHHSTLRLWAWREEFGNESYWGRVLGSALLGRGPEELWPSLTASGDWREGARPTHETREHDPAS